MIKMNLLGKLKGREVFEKEDGTILLKTNYLDRFFPVYVGKGKYLVPKHMENFIPQMYIGGKSIAATRDDLIASLD